MPVRPLRALRKRELRARPEILRALNIERRSCNSLASWGSRERERAKKFDRNTRVRRARRDEVSSRQDQENFQRVDDDDHPRKPVPTAGTGLEFDDWRAGTLADLGRSGHPRLVGLVELETGRLVVQTLRRQDALADLHLLALVQYPDVDGVFGEQAVRSAWRQPGYHDGVLAADHSLHALRRVGNCKQTAIPLMQGIIDYSITETRESRS